MSYIGERERGGEIERERGREGERERVKRGKIERDIVREKEKREGERHKEIDRVSAWC